MKNTTLHQTWPEISEQLLAKYPVLTRQDLILEIGKEGELLKHLQKKLGKNWGDLKKLLSLFG